jgi:uncharacterized protein
MSANKPSHTEEEYFVRVEAEKKKKLIEEIRQKLSEEEKKRIRDLHWMHCPKCGMELHSFPFKGVTIEKCFGCHGIFLDDGELEKVAGEVGGFMEGLMSLFRL